MKVTMLLTDGDEYIFETEESIPTWSVWLSSNNIQFIRVNDRVFINKSQIVWVGFGEKDND